MTAEEHEYQRVIKAEAHSDDHAVEVEFDADTWFKQATDQEIVDLVCCEFGGDYPADAVARDSAVWVFKLADMFTYIEIRHKVEAMGFECHVDANDAVAWIKDNRPSITLNMGADNLEDMASAPPAPKRYKQRVIETRQYIMEYTVEADSAEEAENMVMTGETVEEREVSCEGVSTRDALDVIEEL